MIVSCLFVSINMEQKIKVDIPDLIKVQCIQPSGNQPKDQ